MIVSQELGYFALAVVQAGGYIFKSGCGVDGYLELYRASRGEILEEYNVQKTDDYKRAIYTTYSMGFKKLSAQSAMFLHLCAYLHHDGISEAIFRNTASNVITSRSCSVVDRPGPQNPKFQFLSKKQAPETRCLESTEELVSRANDFLATFEM